MLGSAHPPTIHDASTPAQVRAFFQSRHLKVVTLLGYSGAEYEDTAALVRHANAIFAQLDPKQTIVNIGATRDGIGALYTIAKKKGFATTGIVSTQARDSHATLAACVDDVFYVEDAAWGGFLAGTKQLSPTSAAMVERQRPADRDWRRRRRPRRVDGGEGARQGRSVHSGRHEPCPRAGESEAQGRGRTHRLQAARRTQCSARRRGGRPRSRHASGDGARSPGRARRRSGHGGAGGAGSGSSAGHRRSEGRRHSQRRVTVSTRSPRKQTTRNR